MKALSTGADQLALAEDALRYQVLFEHLPEGLIVFNSESGEMSWNIAGRRILDISESDARSTDTLFEIFDVRHLNGTVLATADWPISRLLRGESIGTVRLRVYRRGTSWVRALECRGVHARFAAGVAACVLVKDITDQLAAEESQMLLAAIVDSTGDAIISSSMDGRITSWNSGAARLLGYSADEVLGQPLSRYASSSAPSLEEARRREFDELCHHKDGRRIELAVTTSPIIDAAGVTIGESRILRDGSELNHHIHELERLNRLYAALSHVNQAIVHVQGRRELFLAVCEALVVHGGFGLVWIGWNDPESNRLVPQASWGKDADYPHTIEIFTDDRPAGRGPSGIAFRTGQPYVCNDLLEDHTTIPWRDAYRRHGFRASASLPIRERGVVQGILLVHSYEPDVFAEKETALLVESAADISFAIDNLLRDAEVRHAAQAVRDEQLFSSSLLESLPGIFYCFDEHGRYLRWNRNFMTVSGYSAEEISCMSPAQFSSNRDRLRAQERIELAFRTGYAELEADFLTKDGREIPYYFTGRRIVVAGITALIGVGIDITKQKETEEQLRQALRLEAVGQLTGGVAHDFNNLLTVILGNAELLVEQLEPKGVLLELSQMIVGAASSAAELTKRLLAFARKQALNPVAIDCNDLVANVLPLLRRTLGSHIDIKLKCTPEVWHALVDPAQLENAILNLCINSRDAMPGGGRLLIQTANFRLDEDYTSSQVDFLPGDYVLISVTDSGCGMPAEIQARAFEPFFTTKEKGRGTGLGLAMVYGFIKQSGGHISIYSEPGEGTAVKMYLPRVIDESSAEGSPVDASSLDRGDETILLVEDDDQVRRLAYGNLTALGYRVLKASNGIEALRLLQQHEDIALLFSDVLMPGGIGGRELADAARRQRPGLKVLFTSGYSEDAIVHNGRLDPGVHLLPKPYRRRELAMRVRAVLDGP